MKKKLQMGIFLILLSMMFVLPVYAGETDGWLDGWDYEIQDDGETVYLTGYNGSSGDLDIYGKVRIDGETYNTVIYYDRKNDKSAFTGNSGIRSITFHAVDGRKVKGSDQYSMWGFFANMTNLESISFGNGFDSSEIQDMKHMFDGDTSLEDIDFENLDVGSCGVFSYSFQKCSSLRDIDVYVPYAYGYSGMFKGCSSLETARIQGERDGGSFTSINYMFEGCSNLKSVELIDVKTGGEGEFKQVFKGCTSLEDIDLSELDFSSATNLTNMFQMCTSLTDIDLSSVDFSNVTDMSGMLAGCKSLESLDLSGHTWVSGGPRMDQIISSCPNLTEIIIDKNIQVSSATSFLGAENDYVKTKVIGQMSDSFKKNAMSKLLIGNRYIAAADVKASINLVRDEAYDSWYYGLKLPNSRIVKVQQNHGSDTIEFGHEDYEIYFGEPGDYTITLTQGNKEYDRRTGTYTVVPVNETEDGVFKCNVNPLTKTIRVTRSDDGSVRIQEI